MSLQLQLFLDYARTHASINELNKIIEVAQEALNQQHLEREVRLTKLWEELYEPWFNGNTFEEKFPITRNSHYGYIYYCLELETCYRIDITYDDIEITVSNRSESKCRLHLNPDGTHTGCVRDGCNDFDLLTSNDEIINYVIAFIAYVYNPFSYFGAKLNAERLDQT